VGCGSVESSDRNAKVWLINRVTKAEWPVAGGTLVRKIPNLHDASFPRSPPMLPHTGHRQFANDWIHSSEWSTGASR
jgi:hypothetical protein